MNPLPYLDGGEQETEYERERETKRERGEERNGFFICICNGAIFFVTVLPKGVVTGALGKHPLC
jgi:hypothetical protein